MVWKKLKKFEDWNVGLLGIVGIFCLLVGLVIGGIINPNPAKETKVGVVCYNVASINNTLHTIEKNCGSTFITHKAFDNGWFVFQVDVCDGKKCESKYIPLEECIKVGK